MHAVYVIWGTDGTILRSSDGEHWENSHTPTAQDLASAAVDSSRNHWLAVGAAGTLIRSSDGARTWQQMATPGVMADLRAVMFDAASSAWLAAGSDGALLRSIDGGIGWKSVDLPYHGEIQALAREPVSGALLLGGTERGDRPFHRWRRELAHRAGGNAAAAHAGRRFSFLWCARVCAQRARAGSGVFRSRRELARGRDVEPRIFHRWLLRHAARRDRAELAPGRGISLGGWWGALANRELPGWREPQVSLGVARRPRQRRVDPGRTPWRRLPIHRWRRELDARRHDAQPQAWSHCWWRGGAWSASGPADSW